MRLGAVAILGLMVGAGVAGAQQGGVNLGPLPKVVNFRGACPGQLAVRQATIGGATVWTTALEDEDKKDQPRAAGSMGVHVEFDHPRTPVQSLELSVSFLPPGLRLMQVDPKEATKDRRQESKTFVLKQEAAAHVDGDLMVGPAATITHVHLISATFADGSVWHAPSENVCTVEPNRVLLVDTKK